MYKTYVPKNSYSTLARSLANIANNSYWQIATTNDEEVQQNYYSSLSHSDHISEQGDFVVMFDIPGVSREDITLTFDNEKAKLIVSAKNDTRNYHYEKKIIKQFNANEAHAQYENGVLTVTVPKGQEHSIEIKVH